MKLSTPCLLTLQLLLLIAPEGKAQDNYYVKTFSTENGLPHNHVMGIAQDQTGFLWIATWDGLSRWNGYEFKNYYNDPADSTSLLYFQTDDVVVDSRNNVWVYTIHGLSRYNREKDNFTSYRIGLLAKVALDKAGTLWYYSSTGLYRWNFKTNNFELIPLQLDEKQQQFTNFNPRHIQFDNENRLWFLVPTTTFFQFYRCNQDEKGVLKTAFIGNIKIKDLNKEYKYWGGTFVPYADSEQNFWVQINNSTFHFDKNSKQFLPHPGISLAKEHPAFSAEELRRIRGNEAYYQPVIHDAKLYTRIKPTYVETYLTDRQNTLWQ